MKCSVNLNVDLITATPWANFVMDFVFLNHDPGPISIKN